MQDILQDKILEYSIHNHGFVRLVDCMPRLMSDGMTADYAITRAARISYGPGTKQVSDDKALIRYLYRHQHTSPFEMVNFTFHCKMPLFIARQWLRHRTASVNEISARYSLIKDEFYFPDMIYYQSNTNKQGSGEIITDDKIITAFKNYLHHQNDDGYNFYDNLIKEGVARETARIALPQNIYTEFYWTMDLRNLLHFLNLRMHKHAQKEIRDYADHIYLLIKDIVPYSCEAFQDYTVNSLSLTALEIKALKTGVFDSNNKRELEEWNAKKKEMGL